MGFFDELINLFSQEEIDKSFKLEVLGKSAVCISGYKKILLLTESEIVVLMSGETRLLISGAKLYVKKLEEAELVVAGVIMNLSIE